METTLRQGLLWGVIIIGIFALFGASGVIARSAAQTEAPVVLFEDPGVEAGTSTLLRTHNGVRMTLRTTGLDPRGTYTVWWVIFNNPWECALDEVDHCVEDDLFNAATGPSILYAAGHVVSPNGKGNFGGSLRAGDVRGCQPPWDDLDLCGEGLEDPAGAEVHLIVRTHGEKVPGMVNEQINTFAGACTPESSFGAGEGPNECVDQQFAIHQ